MIPYAVSKILFAAIVCGTTVQQNFTDLPKICKFARQILQIEEKEANRNTNISV